MASTFPKRICKVCAICVACFIISVGFVVITARDDEDIFARPSIVELVATTINGQSPYDKKAILIEGFWYGPKDGFAITSSTETTAKSVVIRFCPNAFLSPQLTIFSYLPLWMRPEPTSVSHGDRVRVNGIYYAQGRHPPGHILHDCNWLKVSRVEVWDDKSRKWKRVSD